MSLAVKVSQALSTVSSFTVLFILITSQLVQSLSGKNDEEEFLCSAHRRKRDMSANAHVVLRRSLINMMTENTYVAQ